MKKSDIWLLAEKLGTKKENFELDYKTDKKACEERNVKVAKFMGYFEETEEDTE